MSTETTNLGLTKAAGMEKYSLDIVNGNLDLIDAAIGELREALGENSPIVTALEAIKTSIESDTSSAEIAEVKQNTETLKTKVDSINTNVSGNGTKLDTLANKADVISGLVQTVGNNISSVKTTVESTSGKTDTAVELLNLLKALATAKTKTVACGKRGTGSTDWETMITITGAGVLDKAIAYSALASWYVQITIDDEIVVNSKGTYQDFIGAINDRIWGNTPGVVLASSNGTGSFATISPKGAWYFGYSGSEAKTTGCMCTIPGGIKFQKNFKMEVKGFSDFVTVTGEVDENAIVDM